MASGSPRWPFCFCLMPLAAWAAPQIASENDVERLVCSRMKQAGYEAHRQHVEAIQIGERWVRRGRKGQCDWLFVRGRKHVRGFAVCEVEVKKSGERLTGKSKHERDQLEYIARRNYEGVPAVWVNSLAMLERWLESENLT